MNKGGASPVSPGGGGELVQMGSCGDAAGERVRVLSKVLNSGLRGLAAGL